MIYEILLEGNWLEVNVERLLLDIGKTVSPNLVELTSRIEAPLRHEEQRQMCK